MKKIIQNNILLLSIIVIATLGLLDAGYLTYTRYLGIVPPCSVSFLSGCATVAKSIYSVFLGIPLSLIGMGFYLSTICIAASCMYKRYIYSIQLLLLVGSMGSFFSLYFLYLQAYVIKAFCVYCVASALFSFMLLGLAALYNIQEKKKTKK